VHYAPKYFNGTLLEGQTVSYFEAHSGDVIEILAPGTFISNNTAEMTLGTLSATGGGNSGHWWAKRPTVYA